MRRTVLALTALVLALVPVVTGAGAATTVKKVSIHDNYYAPLKLKVRAGTTIKWIWPNDTGDTHDVNLGRRPKGVKPFHSDLVATGYSFKRTLKTPGRYFIYCSLHDDMKMTITVTP